MGNQNIISSSKKEIYTKLLDIAEKYTSISDTDYLKTGLFGYVTESLAMILRDSSLNKSMIYNESFLNTAIIPKSVYNWAKMFNIKIGNATPAYADITINIPVEDLVNCMSVSSSYSSSRFGSDVSSLNTNILILDKEDPIIAGEYYFSLEHSIVIYKQEDSNNQFIAKYIMTEYESTSYQTISSPILPVNVIGNILSISARAYQYQLTKIEKQISSSTFLNKVQTFTFENQFADAKLFYSTYNNNNLNEIKLLYSNIDNDLTTNEYYAYYNIIDSNELEILFKSGNNGFVPAANSKITLYLYTTKGSNVPTSYTGDAIIKFSSDSLQTLPVIVNFNPTTIISGNDAPSIDKVKKTIINEISTRNTIVTESDLNNYFQILVNLLESVSEGNIKFIKKRDDILKRVFNAYILLRDGLYDDNETVNSIRGFKTRCVPTNTVTVNFPIYKDNLLETAYPKIQMNNDGTYTATTTTPSGDYFICPFYLHTILNPIKKVKYIYNLTDNTTNLTYGNLYKVSSNNADENNYYITPSTLRVFRGMSSSGVPENSYKFIFTFKTNFKIDNNKLGSNKLTLSMLSTETGYERESITVLGSDYSKESVMTDTEGVYDTTITLNIPVSDNEFEIEGTSKNYGSNIYLTENNTAFPEEIKLALYFDNFQINNTVFNAQFVTDGSVKLFRNLDDIMLSDIELDYSEADDGTKYISNIKIKDVPVVLASYFDKTDSRDTFEKQLFTYIDILKENVDKLESATFFDLKFFNTYGPSKFYNTFTTNLKLELQITLMKDVSNVANLKTEIRSYIRRLVDGYNESSKLRISDILSNLLINYGQYIENINFVGLNDTFIQYIHQLDDIDETIYPPEWFNIQPEQLEDCIHFN